jgi:bacteriocin biosynthesis cyclodehydratase domain-containing protein
VVAEDRSLSRDARLGIAEGLDLVVLSDNEVLVQFGTRSQPSELLRDTDLTGLLGRLALQLRGEPKSMGELAAGAPPGDRDEVQRLVIELLDRGVLSEVSKSPVDQYLSYTLTDHSPLSSASVCLMGAGPIGVRIAHSLRQHGVGRLILVDERPVDMVLVSGAPRVRTADNAAEALQASLAQAGGSATSRSVANFDGYVEVAVETDLMIVARERPDPSLLHLLNRAAQQAGRPWLLARIDGNFGLVGPLFLPGRTACYNDLAALADAVVATPDMARKIRPQGSGSPFFPGLPAYADIVAGLATLAAVQFLARRGCFGVGRLVVIDFDRMMIDAEDVLRLPRCPVCRGDEIAAEPVFSAEIVTRAQTPSLGPDSVSA